MPTLPETRALNLHIEIERETDGRWVAEATDQPGAMAHGNSRHEALAGARALALRVPAERLEGGDLVAENFADVHFVPSAA